MGGKELAVGNQHQKKKLLLNARAAF